METNEKAKKNGILKVSIILILIVSILALAGFAYARYITRINGNAQAPVAKWSFDSKILNSAQTVEVSDFSVTRTDNNGDVNSETIAPGTSGEFIIEIDATGTETLLTYETKMTLTNKPKNLKFYWDSNKTQEIIVENETYLALNGFMSLSDNKKRDIPIYWDWPLETGSSPTEIEDNDEIDTTFIGKTMSMQIATTGTQVTSNPYANGVASTTINGKITVYNSVQDAIDAAGTNQGAVVTLLDNITNSSQLVISQNQKIVLDLNGKTVTSQVDTISNSGNLKLIGNGRIENNNSEVARASVSNSGYLEVINVELLSVKGYAIYNYPNGTLKIVSGNLNGKTYAIYNTGVANSNEIPAIRILDGTLRGGNCGIYSNSNGGKIVIYSGTIRGGLNGIQNVSNETIIINGGDIIAINGHGIRNTKGTIKMYNGEIEALNGDGIWTINSGGSVLIAGGTIKGGTNGVVTTGGAGVNITIGTNDNVVNSNTPVIMTTSSGAGIIGGSISFYDGIVKVPTNLNLINNYSNATVPSGYHLAQGDNEIIDDVEYKVMYLVKD